jgi:hypothetical protein
VVKGGIALAALTSNALNRKNNAKEKLEQRENKLQTFLKYRFIYLQTMYHITERIRL